MKTCILTGVACFLLLSCNNATDGEKAARTEKVMNAAGKLTTVPTDSMCYLLTEGLQKQDTTIISLAITGHYVEGIMHYLPYGKDRRSGTLAGSIKGKQVHAQWIYMQEGIIDSIAVTFHITDDILKQQHSTFNQHTGKEYFPSNAEYDRYYKRIDCNVAGVLMNSHQ